MAITIDKKKKKQKYLLFVLLGVIIITVVVLWFGFFKEEKVEIASSTPRIAKEIKIDFDFLKGEKLGDLNVFRKISPIEETGRENPFLSY